MEHPADGQEAVSIDVPFRPAPTLEEQVEKLHTRLHVVEAHLGLVDGPPQLNFGAAQLAKVVGIVGLELTDENVEIVRRVISAGNLVSAKIV